MIADEKTVTIATQIGKGVGVAGSSGAVVSGLTLNDIGVIVGIVIAILGFVTSSLISWHWNKKRYRLKERSLEIQERIALAREMAKEGNDEMNTDWWDRLRRESKHEK